MKLHLASVKDRNQFTGYGAGYVAVNNQRYERSIVVTPDALHDDWDVRGVETLPPAALAFLLQMKPEILLLGTGPTHRFPAAGRSAPFCAGADRRRNHGQRRRLPHIQYPDGGRPQRGRGDYRVMVCPIARVPASLWGASGYSPANTLRCAATLRPSALSE